MFSAAANDYDVLDEAVAARMLAGAPWRRFAALGDSLIAGVGDLVPGYRPENWVEQVHHALHRSTSQTDFLNVGQQDRLLMDVIDHQLPLVLAFRPDLVFVNGGGNDLFLRDFDLEVTAARFGALVEALSSGDATVVTFTMFGLPRGRELPEPMAS